MYLVGPLSLRLAFRAFGVMSSFSMKGLAVLVLRYKEPGKREFPVPLNLQQVRALWPRQAKPALLIAAPYVTAQAAERCRTMDLYFADTAGNVYLRGPGLHLYVTGKRKA